MWISSIYKVLNSLHYGVPQSRERVYFVGIRNDVCKGDFGFPEATENSRYLKDFLIDNDSVSVIQGNVYKTFVRYLENKYNRGKYNLNVLLEQDYLVLDTRQSDLRLYYDKIPTLRTGSKEFYI